MTPSQLLKALRLLTLIARYRGTGLVRDLHPSDIKNARHIVTA